MTLLNQCSNIRNDDILDLQFKISRNDPAAKSFFQNTLGLSNTSK